jgi:hypothetical protein
MLNISHRKILILCSCLSHSALNNRSSLYRRSPGKWEMCCRAFILWQSINRQITLKWKKKFPMTKSHCYSVPTVYENVSEHQGESEGTVFEIYINAKTCPNGTMKVKLYFFCFKRYVNYW